MLDVTKPVQTRNGRPARILCSDRKGEVYPLIALINNKNGTETLCAYTAEGRINLLPHAHPADLINAPTKIEVWVNVLPDTGSIGGMHYVSEEAAKKSSHPDAIQVKLTGEY